MMKEEVFLLDEKILKDLGKDLYVAACTKERKPIISHIYPNFSVDDAYKVQKYMIECYINDGYHFSGRKVGMTSDAMRKQFCINEPDYGYLLEEFKYENDSQINVEDFLDPMIEAEIGFVLNADLDKSDVTAEDVLRATDYIVAALEIIDARTQHFDTTIDDSIADNASFGAYIIGDTILAPKEKDLSLLGIVVEKNNKQLTTSSGASVMGNPANAVAWLANKMRTLGEPLKKGEFVLSGSFISAIPVKAGDIVTIRYGGLGEMRAKF